METGKEPPNVQILEDIAHPLNLDLLQQYTSPQQQYTFNDCFINSPNCNGVNCGTQNVYSIDKEFLEKIKTLIDRVTAKLYMGIIICQKTSIGKY